MIDILRRRRNQQQLNLLHPAFRGRFEDLLEEMSRLGRPRLQDAWRTAEQQAKYKQQGKSLVAVSPHMNTILVRGKATPASLAVHYLDDSAPLADPQVPKSEARMWVARLAIAAGRFRLQTGIAWAQSDASALAPGMPLRKEIDAAVAAEDLKTLMDVPEIGFDPFHVEVINWRRFYGAGGPA